MKFSNWRQQLAMFQSLFALLLMIVALSLMTDKFLTVENGTNVLRQISVNLCLSTGMTLVIISAGIDLSVGSILALSGAVAAGLYRAPIELPWGGVAIEFTLWGSIVAGVLVGFILGLINGLLISRLALPPFVATLGMLSIARGLTKLWTQGYSIPVDEKFGFIGKGIFLGVPMPVWIAGTLALLTWILTKRFRFGRHIYAIGGNERAARLTGLEVKSIKTWVYALAGAMAGIAGVLVTARLASADSNAGISYELDSIAAVVIGGTSLSGGRGSILGTILGCLIIGVLNNGLVLLDVSPFWQEVIKGCVILLAVAIDRASAKSA